MIIFSHPTGNANSRALLKGLNDAQILTSFYTTIACFDNTLLHKISALPSLKDLRRRKYDKSLQNLTKCYPYYELMRMVSLKLGFHNLLENEIGKFCIDNVFKSIDNRVASKLQYRKIDAAYAYEDGALNTFIEAKKQNKQCFYDLPIGYWRASRFLLESEIEKWPEWKATLTGLKDSESKLKNKEEELRLADHIFVASSFTAKTLFDHYPDSLAPVHVVPYGFPLVDDNNIRPKSTSGRLKFLFVGGLSQRKGIANLFAATEGLEKHIELTIVGNKVVPDCEPLNKALLKHKWYPSLPHAEVLKLMCTHDVFVFPSLFEGFGLVISEAMSQGVPVITTDRTAGGDFIKHDENGWLIEAGSTEALRNQIEDLISNRSKIQEIGEEAKKTAKKRPWGVYSKEMVEVILKICNKG